MELADFHQRADALIKQYLPVIRRMMRFKGVGSVYFSVTTSTPDIASGGNTIYIGPRWVAIQPGKMRPEAKGSERRERLKRIMHELIHIADGLPHNAASRKIGFYSDPARDTYAWEQFREFERVRGGARSR